MSRKKFWMSLMTAAALCASPVIGENLEPLSVSPGAHDRVTGVEIRCPTFSWQIVQGAVGYEVVVYEIPTLTDMAAWSLDGAMEVLFVVLPGGVTSWTPSLERGLARGADHVWFVRGVLGDEAESATEWSAARFFRVGSGSDVTPDRRGRASSSTGTGKVRGTGAGGAGSRGTRADPGRSTLARKEGETRTKDVGTAMAAIRGEMPDVTGETYGVIGTSNSSEGAGLGAVNTAGGPDLVLDGVEDGEPDLLVSQAGVERSSPVIESFMFTNPDVGELDVAVEGWVFSQQFVGGGAQVTDVDAETLDGIDSAGFSPLAHLHDDRYFTEGELAVSGGGGSVHWDNLGGVPPGFADGIDHDTVYAAGPGVIIDAGRISLDPTVFSTRISVLDSVGIVGSHNSIAIGTDGLGLISYGDFTNRDLKVAHCADAACTSATTATLDSMGSVGVYTSIAIGADGLGLISYRDYTNYDLKVAHCADTACTSATTATVDSVGYVGQYTSIAIGADGLGLISYFDNTGDDLKVAHCGDAACTSATTATLDSLGSVGYYNSIAIGADGLGLISYYDDTNGDLKVAHCADAACTSATTVTLDSVGDAGYYTSIAIGADGLGLISYYDGTDGDLKAAHLGFGVP